MPIMSSKQVGCRPTNIFNLSFIFSVVFFCLVSLIVFWNAFPSRYFQKFLEINITACFGILEKHSVPWIQSCDSRAKLAISTSFWCVKLLLPIDLVDFWHHQETGYCRNKFLIQQQTLIEPALHTNNQDLKAKFSTFAITLRC